MTGNSEVAALRKSCRLDQNLILYASQNPICAGIVARAALFLEGGWDAFPETPTAPNLSFALRVDASSGLRNQLGIAPPDSHTAKGLPSSCGGRCS